MGLGDRVVRLSYGSMSVTKRIGERDAVETGGVQRQRVWVGLLAGAVMMYSNRVRRQRDADQITGIFAVGAGTSFGESEGIGDGDGSGVGDDEMGMKLFN